MKPRGPFLIVGVLLILFGSAAAAFAVWGTSNWEHLSSFLNGLFAPLATIIGFVYLGRTVQQEVTNREFDRAIGIIEKSEMQIHSTLQTPLWIRAKSTPLVLAEALGEALRLRQDQTVDKIYYDEKETRSTDLVKEMLQLLNYLGIIVDTLERTKVNPEELSTVANYYQTRYWDLAKYLCLSTYYFEHQLAHFARTANLSLGTMQRLVSICRYFRFEEGDRAIGQAG